MLRYMTLRLISWNIGQQSEPWRVLVEDDSIDVALIQEAPPPPIGIDLDVIVDGNWQLARLASAIICGSNRPVLKSGGSYRRTNGQVCGSSFRQRTGG